MYIRVPGSSDLSTVRWIQIVVYDAISQRNLALVYRQITRSSMHAPENTKVAHGQFVRRYHSPPGDRTIYNSLNLEHR